jgi:peptidylprolyl isomerase
MPTSKQARAAQNRQKDRLAVAAVEKQRVRRRRRIAGSIVAVAIVAALILGVVAIGGSSSKKVDVSSSSSTPTSLPATSTPIVTTNKKCVAMKGTPPPGAPVVPVQTGPAPKTLLIKDLKKGTGAVVPKGATVTVNYIGVACSTGKIFDSSWSRGQTATFPLTGVIQGWTNGIPGMRVGGRRLLGIPPADAYGASGQGADIGPNEPLWFVVDMVKIGSASASTTVAPTTAPATPTT